MARVLFGWELGANRGHITKFLPIADRLLGEGHDVHLAMQQVDAGGLDLDPRIVLWQAPVWPRLLASLSRPAQTPAATMGDILARLGLDRQGTLSALIAGWDSILRAIDPAFVVADFAPSLLMAARGRVPSAKLGTGFTCPPAHLDRFPTWGDMQAAHDEDELLDIADAELAISARPALRALPEIFASDLDLVTSFAELDPYSDSRTLGYVLPAEKLSARTANGGGGDEIFGYFINQIGPDLTLWDGLGATGKTVRVNMHDPSPRHLERFKALGLIFEPKPLPFDRIVERSRLTISHGGHGFASSSALAGVPQMIVAFDLEKFLVGKAVRESGLGRDHSLFALEPQGFGAILAEMYDDRALRDRCHATAARLAARPLPQVEDVIAGLVSPSV